MQKAVVIANPVASQFTGGSHRDVMSVLNATYDVEALWPGSAAEATAASVQAVDDGATIVVAMGGDGMVHHVAQGLIGTEAILGIVPAGTTNVAARLLTIPSKHTKAARLITERPEPRRMGSSRLILERGETETVHNAVFACGLGLDAEVVRVADADPYRKYRFGSVHYARSALGVGLKDFPSVRPNVELIVGERTARVVTALVQFREVYTYFGKIPIRLNDETPDPMTLLIMERLRRRRIPGIILNALTRRDLGEIAGLEIWPAVESLEFHADPPVAVQADGEGLGLSEGGRIEWEPDSLRIICGA